MGNTVKVPSWGTDITIKDYSRTGDLDAPETFTITTQDLVIDQEKYFNFGVEDLDAAQMRSSVIDRASQTASYKMGQTLDAYVAGLINGIADNQFGLRKTAAALNLAVTSEVKEWAMKQGLPISSLVCVTTPNVIKQIDSGRISGTYGDIIRADATFRGTSEDAGQGAGYWGTVNGLPIYASNDDTLTDTKSTSAESDDVHKWWIFPRDRLSLIVQVNKTEAYRPEKRFMDAVKGLVNYGGKILDSTRFVELEINNG